MTMQWYGCASLVILSIFLQSTTTCQARGAFVSPTLPTKLVIHRHHNPSARVTVVVANRNVALFSTPQDADETAQQPTTTVAATVEMDQVRLKTAAKWRRQDLFGQTLVDQTVQRMESDVDFQAAAKRYAELGATAISKEERANRRRALQDLGIPTFEQVLVSKLGYSPPRKLPTILQLNIGLYCNQACGHCHVESSPLRTEMMTTDTAAKCLELLLKTPSITTLDITGGAPELNQSFRYLVQMARTLCGPDLEIIDRCNLTVLQEPGQEDLIEFLKTNRVRVVASLPCYSAENVDQQRGRGVFERSIAALLALNEAGYGLPNSDLRLDLVYNPNGAFLPPDQAKLEVQYKEQLEENFGILFNSLFALANMPIKRFADYLYRRDELKQYMDLLVTNFNPDATGRLMCLDTISVRYDGKLFDCDFNQQLGYGIKTTPPTADASGKVYKKGGLTVFDLESFTDLQQFAIRYDNHCFGCTAGKGSSCQGATAS